MAHHAAARRQNEQVAAANQLIVQQNLWHAIRAGKRQMVRRAVEDDGGDPMAGNPDEAGITAVHLAAKLSKIGLLEYLLSLPGVDPKVKDSRGRTPADLATNADIRDLLAGHRAEQLHKPPPPPGAPSWGKAKRAVAAALAGAAAVAGAGTAPETRRALAANAAETRAGENGSTGGLTGGDATKPYHRLTRHSEDDPINPRAMVRALHFPLSHSFSHTNLKSPCAEQDGGDDALVIGVPPAAARLPDGLPTPVRLLGAGSVLNALDGTGAAAAGGIDAGAELETAGGIVAAAAKSAAAAKAKAARGSGGGRGPVTKDVFTDGGLGRGSGSTGGGSNRGSVSSDTATGGGQLDADGFPVIEGPPSAAVGAAVGLGQDDFLR